MENKIASVISSAIENGKRMIKVAVMGREDIQDINQMLPHGFDSSPLPDARALHIQTLQRGNNVIAGYVNKNQKAEPGESRIFSTDQDGVEKIDIYLRKDGTMEVGGDSDFMVRYNELESAFNELKSDFNKLVIAYNSHIHITTATVGATAVPGIISPTASTGLESAADITGAKIDNIKTP